MGNSLCFGLAPTMVEDDLKLQAGSSMSFFTVFGLFLGSCLAFLTKYDKDIKLNDLSKKLNIPLNTIQAALNFWEEKGVLTKKPSGYVLNNLKEI